MNTTANITEVSVLQTFRPLVAMVASKMIANFRAEAWSVFLQAFYKIPAGFSEVKRFAWTDYFLLAVFEGTV